MDWFDDDTISRFWSKVEKRSEKDCWIWSGNKSLSGYGRIWRRHNYKQLIFQAHRYSLILHVGMPSQGKDLALHSCDNPSCVNPNHLRWGTYKDNAIDRSNRSSSWWAYVRSDKAKAITTRHGRKFGTQCGKSVRKLNPSQIDYIRRLHSGGLSFSDIALCYEVHEATIKRIILGKTYADV